MTVVSSPSVLPEAAVEDLDAIEKAEAIEHSRDIGKGLLYGGGEF